RGSTLSPITSDSMTSWPLHSGGRHPSEESWHEAPGSTGRAEAADNGGLPALTGPLRPPSELGPAPGRRLPRVRADLVVTAAAAVAGAGFGLRGAPPPE